jgi:hypothetical protein
LEKVHAKVEMMNFRRLERVAFALSGMAASLAVATALWSSLNTSTPAIAAPWEQAAIAISDDASGGGQETAVAQWMVADLSAGTEGAGAGGTARE